MDPCVAPKTANMARQVAEPALRIHSMSRLLLIDDNAEPHALNSAAHCSTAELRAGLPPEPYTQSRSIT